LVNGHVYPLAPTFGLPCPTTIFTFGILLMSVGRLPYVILIIPVLWSVIGSFAIVSFGIKEDAGLLVAGLFTTAALIYKGKTSSTKTDSHEDKQGMASLS